MSRNSIQGLALHFIEQKSDSSFRPLVKRLKPGLLSYVYKFVNDADMSQDIVSQTFINIWEKLDQYNPKWNFSTWAYSIAKNTALGYLREKKKSLSRDKLTENHSKVLKIYTPQNVMDLEVVGPNDAELIDFLHNETIKEIYKLKEPYKTVMIQRVVYDKKIKHIAGDLNWEESTVKTRLRKARQNIADVLKNKYPECVEAWHEN